LPPAGEMGMVERSTCWSRLGVSVAGAAMVSDGLSAVVRASFVAKRKQRALLDAEKGWGEGGSFWRWNREKSESSLCMAKWRGKN
jgi:hypothetical protein